MAEQKKQAASDVSFLKDQLVKSERYKSKADILTALLVDGVSYSFKEVDSMVDGFMKSKF